MKRILHLISLLFISVNLFAQAPQKMTYQAVIRNSSNNLVVSSPVKMKISILQGSTTGTAVYSEQHNPTTNANGLASIEIGEGTNKTGTFSSINWSNGTYFIKTETDPTNGNNLSIVGTSQLLSVPYALHSNCVSSTLLGDTLNVGCKTYILPGILETRVVDHSCGATNVHNPALAYGSMIDQDGNRYRTIKIGNQIWMAENLKVRRYQNGDIISEVKDPIQWRNLTTGATCWYNNDSASNSCPYGRLYNYYVVNDSRKVCPSGWRIPNSSDWSLLINTLGGASLAGGRMKSTGSLGWASPNTGASNSSGFSAVAGGLRRWDGVSFDHLGGFALIWTASSNTYYDLSSTTTEIRPFTTEAGNGLSIRCIKE